MHRLLTVAAGSVLVVGGVAGCGETESGFAAPNSDNSVSTVPSVGDSSSNEPSPQVDPCSLLTKDEISQFGEFEGPDESTQQGDPVCSWRVPSRSASDHEAAMVDLTFLRELGIDDVVDLGNGIQSGKTITTGRDVTRTSGVNPVTETPDCLVSMKVSANSRLDVMVGFTAEPCELAGQIVEMVDSKLPRG